MATGAASSYLRYLPPVLWSADTRDKSLPLGEMLRIFEKLLTGIDDGEIVAGVAGEDEPEQRTRVYNSLQQTIEDSVRLFQPWTVTAADGDALSPERATTGVAREEQPRHAPLDWLAQWVALRQSPSWNEYQRRRALSEIVQIYAKRGTKAGLNKLIELYAQSPLRPRIVIDDASKVLFTRPSPGGIVPIHTLVSQLPLIAPLGIAIGPDRHLYVADSGNLTPDFPNLRLQAPALWRISPWGQVEYDKNGQRPLGHVNMGLRGLKAVAVDGRDPFGVFLLESSGPSMRLFRFTPGKFFDDIRPLAAGADLLAPEEPVAMIAARDGRVFILDRGGAPGQCQIIEVKLSGNPPAFQTAHRRRLDQVLEPLSMVQLSNGNVVIGDAGDQEQAVPARLWQLKPTGDFTPEILFEDPDRARNPLAAPTGIVEDDNGDLLVIDIGLKPHSPPNSPFDMLIARQAAVYRLTHLASAEAVPQWNIELATETHQLVYPRGMTRGPDGTLYICDAGLPDIQGYLSRVWRSLPLAFTVTVHFEGGRANNSNDIARRQLFRSINDVIEDERPVQSYWQLRSSIEP